MGHHDHLGALVDQRHDRRCEPLDPGGIGHDAVLDWYIQIRA